MLESIFGQQWWDTANKISLCPWGSFAWTYMEKNRSGAWSVSSFVWLASRPGLFGRVCCNVCPWAIGFNLVLSSQLFRPSLRLVTIFFLSMHRDASIVFSRRRKKNCVWRCWDQKPTYTAHAHFSCRIVDWRDVDKQLHDVAKWERNKNT